MEYLIPETVLRRQINVFPYRIGGKTGRTVWVKKRRRRDNARHWYMQRALYAVTGLALLVPPAPLPTDSAAFEAGRLEEAARLGLRVPAVLHRDADYFVIEDAGTTLGEYLRSAPADEAAVIDKAAAELRRAHSLGIAHGGAQIKNLTLRDGEIGFIDFEENIPAERLEEFQLRDLFLFLLSLEKLGTDPDVRHIVSAYAGAPAEAENVLRRLAAALRQLRMLRVFEFPLFAGWRLGDIRAICRLVKKGEGAA